MFTKPAMEQDIATRIYPKLPLLLGGSLMKIRYFCTNICVFIYLVKINLLQLTFVTFKQHEHACTFHFYTK